MIWIGAILSIPRDKNKWHGMRLLINGWVSACCDARNGKRCCLRFGMAENCKGTHGKIATCCDGCDFAAIAAFCVFSAVLLEIIAQFAGYHLQGVQNNPKRKIESKQRKFDAMRCIVICFMEASLPSAPLRGQAKGEIICRRYQKIWKK